jgi:hypothetical protein
MPRTITAAEWIEVAVRMQRRANLADFLGRHRESRSYTHRRDYAAKKAKELGATDVWKPISAAVERIV